MNKHITLVLFVFLVQLPLAFADKTDEALEKFFVVMNMEQSMQQTINTVVEQQTASNPTMQKIKPEYMKFMQENLSWSAMKGDMFAIYKKHFTADEIDQMTKFYQTPAGQKAVKVMPQLMAQGMQIGQRKVQEKMPAFIKSIEGKFKDDSKKSGK